jgi:small-conductance mechanosensitive channel
MVLLFLTILLSSACQEMPSSILSLGGGGETTEEILGPEITTPTLAPTSTPGPIEEAVAQVAAYTGADRLSILGLTGEDWINVAISLLIVLLSYVIGTILVRFILPPLIRRTDAEFEEVYSMIIAPDLRWLVVIFTLSFSTRRLVFINPGWKTLLDNLYFTLGLIIVLRIVWKLVDFAEQWYREKMALAGVGEEHEPIITIIRRVILAFIVGIAASVLMSRFGINTNVLTITLGIIGLALSYAARDTIADVISGFVILIDSPFRVGDAIQVDTIGDWGDVKRIGLRTTSILTADNRMVIIPNSTIGNKQVINYTYPDPNYRIETYVRIAYGTDIKTARQIITETIRRVEGVLPEKSVDVLCHEMGESGMVLRVRWWIGNYDDTAFVRNRVIEAIQAALDENGLAIAYPIRDLDLRVTPETVTKLSKAFRESEEKDGENSPK